MTPILSLVLALILLGLDLIIETAGGSAPVHGIGMV
jgi:hypothetical protein